MSEFNDDYTVMYTFSSISTDHPMPAEFPNETVQISFDGTDCTIDTMIVQFEKFLRASGYVFNHIKVVKN